MADYPQEPADQLHTPAPPSAAIKSIAFYSYYDQDALGVLRFTGPAKMAGWNILHGYHRDSHQASLEIIDQADLVVIQKEFCQHYDSLRQIMVKAHGQNKPVILDLDDNIFILPPDHPDRLISYYTRALLPTLLAVMEADLVTVATEPLRQFLLPYTPRIQVIPNYLDDSLWQITSYSPSASGNSQLTIGYMAGNTHQPDLQMIKPALLQLLERFPNRLRYHFLGIDAPAELAPYSRVDWYPPEFFRYDEFASAFQAQRADIMIAPLCDNAFNACKSQVKFLEYGAVGAPGVYSKVRPYSDIVEDGKDGFLASTTGEWLDCLSKLIENPALRQELVQNAQQKIRDHWLLSKNYPKRVGIYSDALAHFHPIAHPDHPFYTLGKSFTEQYFEEQARADEILVKKDRIIRLLEQKIADKDLRIDQLEDELVEYVNSTSWRLTRPLRAIGKIARQRKNA